ncbi:polysaccharide deacetylase family protein [Streptomyces megasporus]|uniref:polysaccharide deacetylase family protein n=1 Tax=Streptomyces megasporus TaxID=44060 RepID=UPI000AC29348|nr:polysaccharide deacetylase family protein [Streptomyces megasporus]
MTETTSTTGITDTAGKTTGTTGRAARTGTRTRRPSRLRRLAMPLLLTTGLCLSALTAAGPAQAGQPNATVVDSTRHGGRTLALTFDDGPNPTDTPRLLKVLREHRVKAVFCLWGDHVRRHPELVRAIVKGGHTLCNHTMRHDDMSTWSPEDIRADLEATNAEIRKVVPGVPIRYFRAPYGSWGATPEVAAEMGMQPLGWRLAIGDWEPPGTDELVRRVVEGVTPGAVVLMHDGGGDRSQTVEAVDRIVPLLRADGWRFDRPARRG